MKQTLLITVLLVALAFNAAGQENLMGLSFFPPDPYIESCLYGPGQQVYTVFLFIYEPVNPDFGTGESRWVENINGFECRLWSEGEATILGLHFPVNAIDAGTNGNTVVGFAEPVPVRGPATVVATVDIFASNPPENSVDMTGDLKSSPYRCEYPTAAIYMAPTRPTQSIEGTMAYLDADDPNDPLVSAYNVYDYPDSDLVMLVQTYPVDTEEQSWGAVKALYR
ncbi:MAG: hypothetical protein KAH56_13335 [Candidatus Krumholzibacteria bacterium]|nr:hypothetical protein [Candidatus Krumholzibacteria bacterium]